MSRLIDADELKKVLKEHYEWWADGIEKYGLAEAIEVVDEVSTFDAVPVVRSRWKYYHKLHKATCQNCSFERDLDADFGKAITCPNCGAVME